MQEVKTYTDDDGRQVNAFFNVNEETLEIIKEEVIYKGLFPVMTNRGPIQLGCDFPDGYTLTQCFEDFDDIARQTVADKQKEQEEKAKEENLIVTPNGSGSNKGPIIFPS